MTEQALYQIFECVTAIFETFIVYQYLGIFFKRKCNRKKLMSGYAVFSVGLMILSVFQSSPLVSLIFCAAGILALSVVLYDSNLLPKFFFGAMFCIMVLISEMACVAVISLLGEIDLSTAMEFGLPRVLSIVIAKLIQVIIVKIVGIAAKSWKNKSVTVEIKRVLPLLLCQVFSIALAHHVFTIGVEVYESFSITVFMSMTGIIYMNIIVFWYFDSIRIALDLQRRNETAEMKLELQKQYYALLEEQQKETDLLHHDIRKHIMLVKALQENGHTSVSDDYVTDLEDHIGSMSYIIQTPQPIISALLTEENRKANNLGIVLNLKVKLSSEIEINPTDLCVLIGNTFDNAIEACAILPPESVKRIDAEIIQKEGLLLISVINPYDPNVKKPSDSNSKHGYGLKNVRKVIAKYGGNIDIEQGAEVFSVRIILP